MQTIQKQAIISGAKAHVLVILPIFKCETLFRLSRKECCLNIMETRCILCPRRCAAPRGEESPAGLCRSPLLPSVARAAAHFGEEPCIAGENGTGAVFFTGCNLRCVFCQNADISRGEAG